MSLREQQLVEELEDAQESLKRIRAVFDDWDASWQDGAEGHDAQDALEKINRLARYGLPEDDFRDLNDYGEEA